MTPLRFPTTRLPVRQRPFGLFSSFHSGAGVPLLPKANGDGSGWGNGVAVDSGVGRGVVKLIDACDNSVVVNLTASSRPASGWVADAFGIEAYDDCSSTFGFVHRDQANHAIALLDLVTEQAVERELWTGALRTAAGLDASRRLATPAATVIAGGTALKPPDALALIEEALSSTWPDVVGVIHAPVAAASAWAIAGRRIVTESFASVSPDSNTIAALGPDSRWLESGVGHCIVAGAGYPGTSPTGATPSGNQEWIYATGPVGWALSDPEVVPDKTRPDQAATVSTNDLTFRALRIAAVGYDGPVFAALVDLTGDYS